MGLTAVVVTHANVVADHVGHGAGHQVRLVRVDVDAQPHRSGRANRVRRRHSGPSDKSLSAVL